MTHRLAVPRWWNRDWGEQAEGAKAPNCVAVPEQLIKPQNYTLFHKATVLLDSGTHAIQAEAMSREHGTNANSRAILVSMSKWTNIVAAGTQNHCIHSNCMRTASWGTLPSEICICSWGMRIFTLYSMFHPIQYTGCMCLVRMFLRENAGIPNSAHCCFLCRQQSGQAAIFNRSLASGISCTLDSFAANEPCRRDTEGRNSE